MFEGEISRENVRIPTLVRLPRDALQSKILAVVERNVCRLSVRLSLTVWQCVATEKHIVKLSKPHCSPIILVSVDINGLPKFQRDRP